MRISQATRHAARLCAIAVLLAGCGQARLPTGTPALPQTASSNAHRAATKWPIEHLVVVIQQNRSFDDLFSGFPGADAPTYGCAATKALAARSDGSACPPGDRAIRLKPVPLANTPCRISNSLGYFDVAWDDGKMDGWPALYPRRPFCPYMRVNRSDARLYWSLAKQFAIADHMFSSTHFGSYTDQFYLLAGTSAISRNAYVVGPPDEQVWGCDAPLGTRTRILKGGKLLFKGPFPCLTQFPTIANRLDNAGVSWKYYYDEPGSGGADWNAFKGIKYVALGKDRSKDLSAPATNVLSDIANGKLVAISFVLSPPLDSDAPGTAGGPVWVTKIYQTLRKSSYWSSSAIVVTWLGSGNGQFYDNVPPPQLDVMGLGFRVPVLAISRYAKKSYVSHTQYEYASLLKFIEENWNLPLLGGRATDKRANAITDMFQF